MSAPAVNDIFVAVARYGALGLDEFSEEHDGLTPDEALELIEKHVRTLGPADRIAVTLTRPWPAR